jgi:hypothetical protein
MANSIYLQLTQPCTERWDNMTPTQQGAYCSSCNKQVIDLTAKTENEIYELVTQHNGEMCARLTKQQLNTPIRKSELVNGWFNWRAIAASLGALLAVEKAQAGTSDSTTVTVFDHTRANITEPDTIQVKPNTITGIVVEDETNQPIYSANVVIKGTTIGAVTDIEGVFNIENANLYKDKILVIRSVGRKEAEVAVNQFLSGSTIRLHPKEFNYYSDYGILSYSYNPLEEEIGPALDLTPLLYRERPRKNKKHRK